VKISIARRLAFDILLKVESGGFASDLLMIHSAALDPRDAGLASEIVFGVLRYRAQLDFLIEHHSGRARKLDLAVRIALRMGFYQIRYLDVFRPTRVKESVELVKHAHKTSAAGFVNALLRQANRDPVRWPTREIELSCPSGCWLAGRPPSGAETATPSRKPPSKSREIRPQSPRPANACRTSARNPSCRCSLSHPGTLPRSLRRAGNKTAKPWNPASTSSPVICTSTV